MCRVDIAGDIIPKSPGIELTTFRLWDRRSTNCAIGNLKTEIFIFCTVNGPAQGVKKWISQNSVVFLLMDRKTTHKPKMGMIHKELWPLLRKNWNFHFGYRKWPKMALRGGVKKGISQNPVVFLLIDPKTTHKPKMGMIHEELWPLLRKNWNFHCGYPK